MNGLRDRRDTVPGDASKPPIPWHWILPLAVTVILAGLSFHKAFVSTVSDMEKLTTRIEALEVWREGQGEKLGKVSSDIAIMQVKFAGMEESQRRMERVLTEGTNELKSLIRQLSEKLDRDRFVKPQALLNIPTTE